MIIRFIIIALFCACMGLSPQCFAGVIISSNSALVVKSEAKVETKINPLLLDPSALIEICSNRLHDIEMGVNSGGKEDDIDMRGALSLMRLNGTAECAGVLKRIIEHPKPNQYLKKEALRTLYAVTGDENLIRPWLNGDSDMLRAVALEILAPMHLGEQAFDEMISKMMKETKTTNAGTVEMLRRIAQMQWFRQSYESETNLNKKVDLLVQNIDLLCMEPPKTTGKDANWVISDHVFSQYLLHQFRLRALDDGAYTRSVVVQRLSGGEVRMCKRLRIKVLKA